MLFDFLRPKTAAPTPAEKPRGFFSHQLAHIENWDAEALEKALQRSFQRKAGEFKQFNADGTTVAMDNAEMIKPYGGFDGESISGTQIAWYASNSFFGYQLCAMIAQHWFVKKACWMPAKDAARHWYDITVNSGDTVAPETLEKIAAYDRAFKIKKHCVNMVGFGRVFGIRHVLPIVEYEDPDAYIKPFNPDAVRPGSYKGISQIDPYWITPELDQQAAANPANMGFYEPTWWRVNGRRIHKSHLIIYRTCEVADVLKPTYYYGGIPLPQLLCERVYAAERTANEAPMLALSKRSTIIHTDLTAAIANQQEFDKRMTLWSWFRDNYGIKILGNEEVAEQFDTGLADFDSLISSQYAIACSISDVTEVKMMGGSPKGGLGANGDSEKESYGEFKQSIQSDDFDPLVERHHLLTMKSFLPDQKFRPVANWNPVDTPTAEEQSRINLAKAQADEALCNTGAIDGQDVRRRLIADKTSGYNGISDVVPRPDEEDDPDAPGGGNLTDKEDNDDSDRTRPS
jgi:uncharacterized protein